MNPKKILKYILIGFGWIFVALGIIGIFVPLMPTTVFFILAAASFARSSDRFYSWLINHPRFGKFIKDYREKRGMPLKSKIIAVGMLYLTIGSSAYFFTDSLWVRLLLISIAIGVSTYILSLKTIRDERDVVGETE
ncbi:MAG TPA: YbaN family protein [Melioribacteraceae bacterium]|nr:YbaN family protein [Melioribacteraceae bacterium]